MLREWIPPPDVRFDNGTGEKLHNVHVQLIFWGACWNNNPLAQSVVDAVKNLLARPYMTYLAQYDVRRAARLWVPPQTKTRQHQ